MNEENDYDDDKDDEDEENDYDDNKDDEDDDHPLILLKPSGFFLLVLKERSFRCRKGRSLKLKSRFDRKILNYLPELPPSPSPSPYIPTSPTPISL